MKSYGIILNFRILYDKSPFGYGNISITYYVLLYRMKFVRILANALEPILCCGDMSQIIYTILSLNTEHIITKR